MHQKNEVGESPCKWQDGQRSQDIENDTGMRELCPFVFGEKGSRTFQDVHKRQECGNPDDVQPNMCISCEGSLSARTDAGHVSGDASADIRSEHDDDCRGHG